MRAALERPAMGPWRLRPRTANLQAFYEEIGVRLKFLFLLDISSGADALWPRQLCRIDGAGAPSRRHSFVYTAGTLY